MNLLRHLRLPVLISSLTLAVQAAPQLPGVGAAMQGAIDAHEIAGAVTLVATKAGVVHLEATGFSNVEKRVPMAVDSMFWLASTTKPFAGVSVLMMQDEGKLNVNDLVAKYIPEFAALKTPSGKPANLTLLQLLTHTSGLGETKREDYPKTKTLADLIPLTLALPMQFEPGERWKYTSSGINTLGRIVEIVSGQPFEVFVQERILTPLGMKDTTFYPTAEQLARLAGNYSKDRATGELHAQTPSWFVQVGNKWPTRGNFPPVAAGGLFSTASDLGQFGRMLLNHGTLDGHRYISEAAYQVLTTVHTGDLSTGYSAGQMNKVLGWGAAVFIVRAPHAGLTEPLSAGSFGHPGALGTDLIVDPVKGVVYVMMIQRSNLPDNFENEPGRVFVQAASAALAKGR
ncbi:MAG TPA: serine hydrolase domain-containing protein [Opitutaceae bacterium]|nr:serine hydrolase domain-containing protein [Opitutaceae bacterium]